MNKKRLLKEADFLDNLDESKFSFDYVISDFDKESHCGSVCCAMGWTPELFPELVRWVNYKMNPEIQSIETGEVHYAIIAEEIFDISSVEVDALFTSFYQSYLKLPTLHDDATPKQVADNIRLFVERKETGYYV